MTADKLLAAPSSTVVPQRHQAVRKQEGKGTTEWEVKGEKDKGKGVKRVTDGMEVQK